MPKPLFYNDYSEGAHPEILAAIVAANEGQALGYGEDQWCAAGADAIRAAFGIEGGVHYVTNGTQANQVGLAALLRPYEGVIAAVDAHINVHETGAVEATGHKIIGMPSPDGKLRPADLDAAMADLQGEHSVLPAAVSITVPTELGAAYTYAELDALIAKARALNLNVFVDGARLAIVLGAPSIALSIEQFAALDIDIFWAGGTKVGGMSGDALVVRNPEIDAHFRYHLKQRGGLLAKQRYLGAQFARFFADDQLWLRLGAESVTKAMQLADGLAAAGVAFWQTPETNQLFALLPEAHVAALEADFGFYRWTTVDEQIVVRFVCSWTTPDADIDALITAAQALR